MCGIIGIFGKGGLPGPMEDVALEMARKIRHRGPDWSGLYSDDKAVIAHERLSIVDIEHGAQPLYDKKEGRILSVNGEIYNHMELRKKLRKSHEWQTASDCEIILHLYDEYGPRFVGMLSGIFAFILYDQKKGTYFIARDHIGIVPLYTGRDERGVFYVASELKALEGICTTIEEFPPGHYLSSGMEKPARWYRPSWRDEMPVKELSIKELRDSLEDAVRKQLMSDVPFGILISGGLDSSIISAIATKYRKKRIESGGKEEAWWPRLHSFAIGLEGSPDLEAARKVAKHLGTAHHEITYTIEEGFRSIRDVIYHLETFDVTTIRAATPMYLMARKIKSMGIKMVLSGEGADEVFGGYLYFHKAPSRKEFHDETLLKLSLLSKYDCLRANKAMAAWGVEARVPFLDKEFLDVAMGFDPKGKMCSGERMEKYVLRKAFENYLPKEIVWRQKEQFSDGVGYGWIDHLKQYAEEKVSDEMMSGAKRRFPVQTPLTKEEYVYREIFSELFKSDAAASTVPTGPTIACSTATAFKWSKEFENRGDPSGRAVAGVHKKAMGEVIS